MCVITFSSYFMQTIHVSCTILFLFLLMLLATKTNFDGIYLRFLLFTIVLYTTEKRAELYNDRVATGQGGKSQGNLIFLQGQGKVREFCKLVRKVLNTKKVREKSGNFIIWAKNIRL